MDGGDGGVPEGRPAHPIKCATCNAELTSPMVCAGCRTLNPAATTRNHFELLGIPQTYAVDVDRLDEAYRALSRSVHPDRFSTKGEDALRLSVRLSAALNQAYAVLRDPTRRAEYLLELSGGPSTTTVRDVPGNFLGEVMMLREEIETLKSTSDSGALGKLHDSIAERRRQILEEIEVRAMQLPSAPATARIELLMLLNSIKYLDNLLSESAADPLATAGTASNG